MTIPEADKMTKLQSPSQIERKRKEQQHKDAIYLLILLLKVISVKYKFPLVLL